MYEASQHTIIARKPAFPSSAGGCRAVSTIGSPPQNVAEQSLKQMVDQQRAKQSNPSTLRGGSLTPVELTPPPSAATTRTHGSNPVDLTPPATNNRAASLSKYSLLDSSFQFYRIYISYFISSSICVQLLFCLKRTARVKSPCLHEIISFHFFLSFIELPFIEIPTPVISPASAPVPSPASWARLTKARLAEQVLGMPLRQKSMLLVVLHSHTIWHQKRQYLIAPNQRICISDLNCQHTNTEGHSAKYPNKPCIQYVRVKTVGVSGKLLSADISSLLHAHV